MKKEQIKQGSIYNARVSGNFTTVRVDSMGLGGGFNGRRQITTYACTNLNTGQKVMFKSAARFISEVKTVKGSITVNDVPFKAETCETVSEVESYTTCNTCDGAGTDDEGNRCEDCDGKGEIEDEKEEESDDTPKDPPFGGAKGYTPLQLEPEEEKNPTLGKLASGIDGEALLFPEETPVEVPAGEFKPTAEQTAILEISKELEGAKALIGEIGQRVLVICAGAGTGKTSTLKLLEKVLKGNGQYTAFNSSLCAESKSKFSKCAVNTTHSLAFREVGKRYAHRLKGSRVKSYQVARMLGLEDFYATVQGKDGAPQVKRLVAAWLAGKVMKAISKFCQSADSEITVKHFPYIDGIDSALDGKRSYDNNDILKKYLLPFAKKAWSDLSSVNGTLPFSHDVYVKLWSMGEGPDRPVIAADYILLDECFPAGTMIETDVGIIEIEKIAEVPGKWRVLSSLDGGKTVLYSDVTAAYKTPRNGLLVEIAHAEGKIRCTANHPFHVQGKGWVAAGLLQSGDSLSCLPIPNGEKATMLLPEMRGSVEGTKQESGDRDSSEAEDFQANEGSSYRDSESNGKAGDSSQVVYVKQGARSNLLSEGREWKRANRPSNDVTQGAMQTPSELAVESRTCRIEWTTKARSSDSLQDRRSLAQEQDRNRNRRGGSSKSQGSNERLQEGQATSFSRVDSVKVLQQGDNGESRSNSSESPRFVYTLSVKAGSYFADGVLVKNCQDTAPVFLHVLKQQKHALLLLVGDENQQIYEWRGASNAMKDFPKAPRKLLSQSFRFGQAVADVANSILARLDEKTDLVMKGLESIPSRICEVASPRCYLYCTNAGAVGRLMSAMKEGKRGHLIGGSKEVVDFCKASMDLQSGKGTSHQDLGCFSTWNEVVAYSKEDGGEDLRLMVKLITKFGADKIHAALENMPSEENADLVLSTAHRSKGREWSSVKLGPDFPTKNKLSDSDRRLLYVACTRAQEELDITACPTFCGGYDKTAQFKRGDYEITDSDWIPGIKVNYTAEIPSEEELAAYRQKRGVERVVASAQKLLPSYSQENSVNGSQNKGNGEAQGFTWANVENQWCVRGPGGMTGKRVTVTRKNGSKSEETLHRVVKKLDGEPVENAVWFYGIAKSGR